MRISIPAVFLAFAACQFAQDTGGSYGGPAVLSRGQGASITSRSEDIRFRPFVAFNGIYDSGLQAVSVTPEGTVDSVNSYGAEAIGGVYGYKTWKRTVVGLDYRGSYRHYTPQTYFNGSDQVLSLIVTHQPTRRTTFTLREAAGTNTRGMGLGSAFALVDPLFANVPRDQLFDGRVYYTSTMGDLTYQKSVRTSFNMGADHFLMRYRSQALYGVTGERVRGDVAYRYNRRGTIGVAYDFMHFGFTKNFGGSDVHSVSLVHSVRLSRFWEWQMKAGGAKVETLGVARVVLDPVIAAIIGQSVGIQAVHRVNYVPYVEAKLSRQFRRASLEFSYSRGVSPGNGLYLTSVSEGGGGRFGYTGIRKWNFGASARYNSYRSLTLTLGKYRNFTAGGGVTYQLMRHMHMNLRLDGRKYIVDGAARSIRAYDRVYYHATVGIAFSPGELPLSLW